jgi:hypothetical protein
MTTRAQDTPASVGPVVCRETWARAPQGEEKGEGEGGAYSQKALLLLLVTPKGTVQYGSRRSPCAGPLSGHALCQGLFDTGSPKADCIERIAMPTLTSTALYMHEIYLHAQGAQGVVDQ